MTEILFAICVIAIGIITYPFTKNTDSSIQAKASYDITLANKERDLRITIGELKAEIAFQKQRNQDLETEISSLRDARSAAETTLLEFIIKLKE